MISLQKQHFAQIYKKWIDNFKRFPYNKIYANLQKLKKRSFSPMIKWKDVAKHPSNRFAKMEKLL